ncbi:MAG TPA: hypothetical protein VHV78_04200, partial [Gemmatimonadaceae bacterium]|nr:hypothetical protein [Gemmatimonadaceae bacterium]
LASLDRDLRVAGVGVVDAQPLLVEAAALAITFNADLVALDTGDLGAVYINPTADSAGVDVMRNTEKLFLPGTNTQYPDSTYLQSVGVPSNAETISYWLSHDSTSSHSNEYILFRRVNARPAAVVARGILYNPGDTIFQYFKGDTSGALTPVSGAALPLVHSAAVHGSTADTGSSALTDSIREVQVQFTSIFHDPRTGQDVLRRLQSTIHLMNAGLIHHTTCGNAPLGFTATATVVAANPPTVPQTLVRINWTPSTDDGAGENDVQRYAVYRRLSSASTFDEPFASVSAGSASYSFADTDVQSGQTWVYGVTAQDCTPSSSPMVSTAAVVIP